MSIVKYISQTTNCIRLFVVVSIPLLVAGTTSFTTSEAELEITFQGIASQKGTIRLAIYKSEKDFMDNNKADLVNVPVFSKPSLKYSLKNIKPGIYALAFFHDENDNFKLDKNIIGIPKEPYGFSNMPESKWRVPEFKEVLIIVKPGKNQIAVQLKKWQL